MPELTATHPPVIMAVNSKTAALLNFTDASFKKNRDTCHISLIDWLEAMNLGKVRQS